MARQAGLRGRLPQREPGNRLPIRWLHEYAPGLAATPVTFPIDVSQGTTDWLMLGNGPDPTLTINTPNGLGQPVGDCYFAAEAHDTMLAGARPTADAVVGEYLTYDNGQDNGVIIADALLWQYHRGEIGLFAPVHPQTVPQVMTTFKRGILEGVNLTDDADQLFESGQPWTTANGETPDPSEGHVVYRIKMLGDGTVVYATWGADQAATPGWAAACPEEWWMILTPDDEAAIGAEAYAALAADLAALPGATGTPPGPPSPPVVIPPAPTPNPPSPTPAPTPAPTPPDPNVIQEALDDIDAALINLAQTIRTAFAALIHHFGEGDQR